MVTAPSAKRISLLSAILFLFAAHAFGQFSRF